MMTMLSFDRVLFHYLKHCVAVGQTSNKINKNTKDKLKGNAT